MTQFKKTMILIEVTDSRSQLCDILTYVATTEMEHSEKMIVFTTIIEKMRAI